VTCSSITGNQETSKHRNQREEDRTSGSCTPTPKNLPPNGMRKGKTTET